MRSPVLSNRQRVLGQVAVIALLAGVAGCSSDFTRFDRNLYSALPQSQQQTASNPYPGDIDPTTTASIRPSHPTPLGDVSPAWTGSDDGDYRPALNSANNGGRQPLNTYRPAPQATSSVTRSSLPKPTATNRQVDTVTTSSVSTNKPAIKPASPLEEQPAPNGVGGWTGTGGTSVTLRSGETLYNLSKRYGVPVKEIMRVNSIANADNVQAGQRIIIPTYVYSKNAPISAPDNNPNTRAAKATRGQLGQADPSKVIVPEKRPEQVAALDNGDNSQADQTVLPTRKVKPWTEDTRENVPDYSVVTGSVKKADGLVDGKYEVVSGDSLSKIGSRYGVSTAALMQANGLTETTIRVGQVLKIPGAETVTQAVETTRKTTTQPKAYTKPTIDKTVTSAVETKAPDSSGFGKLRWPVNGRVVSAFGASKNGQRNDGIDISVPEGTAVKAAENGIVIYSGSDLENFGNLVLIRHQNGLVTAYAHNKYNSVKKGDRVTRGQVIAASGRTGSTTSPVLHFEVRKNSKPVDPKQYLGG